MSVKVKWTDSVKIGVLSGFNVLVEDGAVRVSGSIIFFALF
ncbi:hypothetical protein [Roseivirga sp.]